MAEGLDVPLASNEAANNIARQLGEPRPFGTSPEQIQKKIEFER
jgi:hypothetical protein